MAFLFDGNVVDSVGRGIAGAFIYIYDLEGVLASLSDSNGDPILNPVTSGEDGYWSAYVANEGYYTLRYNWSARERLIEANRVAGRTPLVRVESAAAYAEGVSGPTYPDTVAGLASTTDGQMFAVGNGDGTVTVYLNDGGVASAQRTLATTVALASSDAGKGAALVGLENGSNAQKLADGSGNLVTYYEDINAALAAGGDIRGDDAEHELTASVTALSVNSIRDALLSSQQATDNTLQVGGLIDSGTSIALAQSEIAEGAREVSYVTITGPLAAGDWVAIQGHMREAWTDEGGRNVMWRGMMQVRSVDTVSNVIKFRQGFPYALDAKTISKATPGGVNYGISGEKVLPKDHLTIAHNVLAENVTLDIRYVIDTDIDLGHKEYDGHGSGLSVQYATNCHFVDSSRNRNTDSGKHNVLLEGLYNCTGDILLGATNPVANAGKGLRGNSWSNCTVDLTIADAGFGALVLQVVGGGRVKVTDSGSGTYNIDNNVTTPNRNDCISINYGRNAHFDIVSTQTDCTAVEFFGCINCTGPVFVTRQRAAPTTGATGVISIKGICVDCNFGIVYRGANDVNAIPLQLEFSDNETIANGHQRGNTIHCDIKTDATVGVYARQPGAQTDINTDTLINGIRIEAQIPITLDPEIGGFTIKGLDIHTNAGTEEKHAIVLSSTGNTVCDCHITGTSVAGNQRAVASAVFGNKILDCTSDGGYFYEADALDATFDLSNYVGLRGAPLYCNNDNGPIVQFHPANDGAWEVEGLSEILDGTINEFVLDVATEDAPDPKVPFGTWSRGDRLRKRNAELGEIGWIFDGTYWRREGARVFKASSAFDTGAIPANDSYTLDVAVSGVVFGDKVSFGCDVSFGDLPAQAFVQSSGTVRLVVANHKAAPLGAAITGNVDIQVEKARASA